MQCFVCECERVFFSSTYNSLVFLIVKDVLHFHDGSYFPRWICGRKIWLPFKPSWRGFAEKRRLKPPISLVWYITKSASAQHKNVHVNEKEFSKRIFSLVFEEIRRDKESPFLKNKHWYAKEYLFLFQNSFLNDCIVA